jgi:catalase
VLNDYDKKELVKNVSFSLGLVNGPKKDEIVNRQLCHFFRADIGLGMAIAQQMGINPEQGVPRRHGVVNV